MFYSAHVSIRNALRAPGRKRCGADRILVIGGPFFRAEFFKVIHLVHVRRWAGEFKGLLM
jgi:hypothetical protein